MINRHRLALQACAVLVLIGLIWWIPALRFLGSVLIERASVIGAHQWLNIAFAFAGALVAFGAINRMNRHTDKPIAFAFVTMGTGLLGAVFSYFSPERWEIAFDTLIFGGALALLIGTRRHTIWMDPKWMPPTSVGATFITWAAFFLTVRG